jgi:hypothetical protein
MRQVEGRAGLQARVEGAPENPSAVGTADRAFPVPPLRGSDSREVLDAGLKARSTRTIQIEPCVRLLQLSGAWSSGKLTGHLQKLDGNGQWSVSGVDGLDDNA